MSSSTRSRLARLAVLLALTLGVLALGLQPTAWATTRHAQGPSTVVTRTPPANQGPQLNLIRPTCSGQDVRVQFVVANIPSDATDLGSVSYVVNGQTRTATLSQRSGGSARYVDTIRGGDKPANGVYDITSASVTITTPGGTLTPTLNNPGRFTVQCRRPPEQDCRGPMRRPVDPSSAFEMLTCQWSLTIGGGDINVRGELEARQISPASGPPPNAGDTFFGQLIELTLFDADGNALDAPQLAGPVELCVVYTADDLARAGSPSNFVIQTYDETARRWVDLPTTPDPANSRVCTTLPHLSLYALASKIGGGPIPAPGSSAGAPTPRATAAPTARAAGVQAVPVALPNTGAPAEPGVPAWQWGALALALGGGLALLARRRPKA